MKYPNLTQFKIRPSYQYKSYSEREIKECFRSITGFEDFLNMVTYRMTHDVGKFHYEYWRNMK